MKNLFIYLVLLVISVPWYWMFIPDASSTMILGVPSWVVVSVTVSACVSVHTALILRRPWPGEEGEAR